jgi:hypothetical protein
VRSTEHKALCYAVFSTPLLPHPNRSSATQINFLHFMQPECSFPYSQESASLNRGSCSRFVTCLSFYGEVFLAPRPTPKLEDHPLSGVRGCIFNIFAPTFNIWKPFLHPQPEDAPWRGGRDPLVMELVEYGFLHCGLRSGEMVSRSTSCWFFCYHVDTLYRLKTCDRRVGMYETSKRYK